MAETTRFEPALGPPERPTLVASREDWLERALGALRATPEDGVPQHRLLVGPAGTGKSLLLRLLADTVRDSAPAWSVALLPEELGEILQLSDLWRATGRALGAGDDGTPAALRAGAAGRRIALLVDGFDRLLARIPDEHWSLRDELSSGDVALVGACRELPGSAYAYDAAFYDFFAVDRLEPFTPAETTDCLLTRAREHDEPAVARALDRGAGLVRALHDLCGGSPRLVHAFADALREDGEHTDPGAAIAHVLDRAAPEHRAVLDSLSDQARAVLIALANAGEPAAASDVAARLDMPSNKASAYLSRLGGDGIVEKVPLPEGRSTGYQIADRCLALGCFARSGHAKDTLARARALADAWTVATTGHGDRASALRAVFGEEADALRADPERTAFLPPETRELARALLRD